MRPDWWRGTGLVLARVFREGVTSRGWRVLTVLLLLGGVSTAAVSTVLDGRVTSHTLVTVGPPAEPLRHQLAEAGLAARFTVRHLVAASADDARRAVQEGRADVALVTDPGGQPVLLVGQGQQRSTFPTLVADLVRNQETVTAMSRAGMSAAAISAVQSIPMPAQVTVGPVADQNRAGIGFGIGIVLYLALILVGTGIATTVATEKSTGVSEVLLGVLRPTQLLVGTVIGTGLLTLVQLCALAVPVAAVPVTTGNSLVTVEAAGDVLLALVWFALGLALYAFAFAALAALVDKVTELNTALIPVNLILLASYLLTLVSVSTAPDRWVGVTTSLVPFSAPIAMPVRWASGSVPTWQLLAAMAGTAGTAVLTARAASALYRRAVVRTGGRMRPTWWRR